MSRGGWIVLILVLLAAVFFGTRLLSLGIGLLILMLLWALAGYLAARFIVGGKGLGWWGSVLLGLAGGWVGANIFSFFGIGIGNWLVALGAGVVGASVLIVIVRLFDRRFAR
jgi:uncharacterized membrane protein YeaQ/YmgE (transglycosylase-associated protein family)